MLGGHVIFCDDIREELHGKLTYVGRYQNTIDLPVPVPTVMAKLALVVVWSQTIDEEMLPVTWELMLPWQEKPLATGELDLRKVKITDSSLRPEERVATMETGLVISPFEIKTTGDMRVVATRAGRRFHLRRIEIRSLAKQDDHPEQDDNEAD